MIRLIIRICSIILLENSMHFLCNVGDKIETVMVVYWPRIGRGALRDLFCTSITQGRRKVPRPFRHDFAGQKF